MFLAVECDVHAYTEWQQDSVSFAPITDPTPPLPLGSLVTLVLLSHT